MNRNTLVVIISMLCFNIAFAEQITPSQLLEKYKSNMEALKTHIIKSEQLGEVRDTAYGDTPKWHRETYEFRTDGKKIDLIMNREMNLDSPDDKVFPEYISQKRSIWDDKKWIECNYGVAANVKTNGFVSNEEHQKNIFVSVGYGGSTLDGTFFGDLKRIEIVLSQASEISLRPKIEAINGSDCYVIDAITPNGKYNLWIDPEHGYNIAKAKVQKVNNDLLGGKPVNYVSAAKKKAKFDGIKTETRKEFLLSLDKVEFQKVNDVWVPMEATIQYTSKYMDGRVITEQNHHKRTFVDLDPDFNAVNAFVPDIPDGTPMGLHGGAGIGFEWLQGKMVPNIDKFVIAELDRMAEEIMAENSNTTVKKHAVDTEKQALSEQAETETKSQVKHEMQVNVAPEEVLVYEPQRVNKKELAESTRLMPKILFLATTICLILAICYFVSHRVYKKVGKNNAKI